MMEVGEQGYEAIGTNEREFRQQVACFSKSRVFTQVRAWDGNLLIGHRILLLVDTHDQRAGSGKALFCLNKCR